TPSSAVAYNEVNSLAAGAQLSETNSISTANLSVGQHTLYIMEDYYNNNIAESNEANNTSSVTFNITAPSSPPPSTLPDLIVPVANISVPASVQQGTALSISYVVQNQGGTGAGHHWAGINVDAAPTPSSAVAYNEV